MITSATHTLRATTAYTKEEHQYTVFNILFSVLCILYAVVCVLYPEVQADERRLYLDKTTYPEQVELRRSDRV